MSEGWICDGCGRAMPYSYETLDLPEAMAAAMGLGGMPVKRIPPSSYIVVEDPELPIEQRSLNKRHVCDYTCLELWSIGRRLPREAAGVPRTTE